ncbi:cytidylate kinase [Methylophilales bacterium MBRSG12]|uniref:Cytidylate kinase n=1 Tax=Methylophilales bacterium MBRS-H7 TaxID=1623450 RepID=A0A0H4JA38_9PROT|nr:cytidylate kinase [Methylophilales bacterium MBRSF5]AKO65357.1 cytidylate kinase [Methylophilales bacterium MBRS-H7]AKO66676.1 cytidylate kinase [Methylophilales bacterium MBRSG12]
MNLITIDGPAGSGKGTIAKQLSQELKLNYLDSGAIYRILGFHLKENNTPIENDALVKERIQKAKIQFMEDIIYLNDRDVTDAIRTESIAKMASLIAAKKTVRESILDLQRSFLQKPGLVAEGRDMGTVVFPEAKHKFFLTATVEERASRRYKQLISKGFDVIMADLVDEIQERDFRDTNRTISPLVPAANAVIIDTTELSPSQVIEFILGDI